MVTPAAKCSHEVSTPTNAIALGRRSVLLGSASALGLTLTGASPSSAASTTWVIAPLSLVRLDWAQLPYNYSVPIPLERNETFDSEGIVISRENGQDYDHPVAQAQYMLHVLSSYYLNKSDAYLSRAVAHARRIMSYAIRDGAKALLPYRFAFSLHGRADGAMAMPWFSAMAQGQALSAFVRLHELTGSQEWLDFAGALHESLVNPTHEGAEPWVSRVDSSGHLWFEEFPRESDSDRAFNGHTFAVYGLYDFWRVTNSSADAVKGGVTSVLDYFDTHLRNPGYISHYCITHHVQSVSYHNIHVNQLYKLSQITGSAKLAAHHDALLRDYPTHVKGGVGYLGAGAHEVADFGVGRRIVGRSTVSLASAQSVKILERAKSPDSDAVWLRIELAALDRSWVRETPNHAFIKPAIEGYRYAPPRLLQFASGTYTAYKFNTYGTPVSPLTHRLAKASAARVLHRLVNNGREYYLMYDGIWKGYFLPAQEGVRF